MLDVSHTLLQFANIMDPVLSTAALFFRFCSHMIQIWAIKADSYLVRWFLKSHVQCSIESAAIVIRKFNKVMKKRT